MTVRNSTTARLVIDGGERLRAAAATATVTDLARDARATVDGADGAAGAAFRASAVGRSVAWFGRAARESWLYRWLTAEPEPDVVVIDLRETWTVGPVLAVLDSVVAPLERHAEGARSREVGVGVAELLAERPVQTASVVVFAAVLANIVLSFALGSPSNQTVGFRLLVASVALAGTRVTASADELAETRAFEFLVAILEPPEPPGSEAVEDEEGGEERGPR